MDPNSHHLLLEEKNNNFVANPRSDCAMLPMQDQQAVKPDQHSDIEMRTETEKTTQTLCRDAAAEAEKLEFQREMEHRQTCNDRGEEQADIIAIEVASNSPKQHQYPA